ncbi:hypothetical protein [Streptomyces sp. NBC_00572]|uniref:hypothetical protein n=1 Tax=Streptomyces sp. NBC_00572 TaxID=2903664 RepID=UPI00225AA429|nr:hypothetical protein [Streptomyces sp. NBC_00572]MCX4980613.1 peptidase inhibitor family I36 protein [Streptomyces sp. NBC_00572]
MSMATGLRKKAAVVAATTALLVGGGVVTATSASAGYMCGAGYHCVFWGNLGDSASHDFYNSDTNFTNDYFSNTDSTPGSGEVVNDNVSSASNSSTGGYESHYYRDINYGGGLLFCVNPGSQVFMGSLNATQRDSASSLQMRPSTTIHCF